MRIAHLLRKFDTSEWGGTEMALERLFSGLSGHGIANVIYAPETSGGSDEARTRGNHYSIRRFRAFVPILGISQERRRQLVAVGGNLMSFDLVSGLFREPGLSVIHTHTLGRLGGIALSVAKARRLPFVVTIHGGVLDLPEPLKQSFNAPTAGGWEYGRLFGLLFQARNLFVDADAILTCNQNEAALLRKQHPTKRIVVQPHAVPVDVYRVEHREAARRAFPEIRGRKVLLSLGRIDPVKNQSWLLDQAPAIFRRFPEALLVLAGPCTDEPYGKLVQQRIRDLGIAERVLLTGPLTPNSPELLGLLQDASVLLLPSLSETFGLVILEAWAAGTTVLCSRTSGASALIEHGVNGWLFDLDRPQAFHESLSTTLDHPEISTRLAAAGAERVGEEFSIGAIAAQVGHLYEELAEMKSESTARPMAASFTS